MAMGAKNLRTCNVAAECGINSTCLSSFLSGQRNIKYEQLETLVAHMGLTLVPKKAFRFRSEFMEKKEEERQAKIAARRNE